MTGTIVGMQKIVLIVENVFCEIKKSHKRTAIVYLIFPFQTSTWGDANAPEGFQKV